MRPKGRPARSALETKLENMGKVLARADRLYPMPSSKTLPPPRPGTWTRGDTGEAPRDHLPTLIELRDVTDLHDLLDRLTQDHEYLENWAVGACKLSGFLLSKPLVGAWLVSGEGLEEWSPKHELVNRATRLLLLQRYGRMPQWFSQGLGWQAEIALLKTVYCFPGRDGFVFVIEHSDWDKDLRRLFKNHKGPLSMREIVIPRTRSFQSVDATRSWGVVEYLVRRHPEAIAPFLADLAEDRRKNGRVGKDDETWELVPTYEAAHDVQQELLRRHAGEDIMEELLKFMERGAK